MAKQVKHKIKTDKFITLKTLEYYYIFKDFKYDVPNKIPATTIKYIKTDVDMKIVDTKNIFNYDKHLNINDVYYVKFTLNKSLIDDSDKDDIIIYNKIHLNNYQYNNKKIIISKKPTYKAELYETASLIIPIDIFKLMVKDENKYDMNNFKLSSLFKLCINPFDIRLLDKDKKTVGYVLTSFEY